MTLPRVQLFLLGGTITMNKSTGSGVVPTVDAAELCRAVPGLDRVADLHARTDMMIASANLTYQNAFDLAAEIIEADNKDDADGFVIVQGTDTLEEMAFLLDCLLDIKKPVVVTGAMRSPAQLSADGPANIMAAVTCAATREIGLAGVVVVLNDDIHSARFVTKTHTGDVGAFRSPNCGPIGRVVEGAAHLFSVPIAGPKLAIPSNNPMPNIALIKATFGDDGTLLRLLENSDLAGLVIEGFGAGHLPEAYLDVLDRLASAIPVILSSRVGAGHIFRQTYGYKGAEIDLIQRGLIPSVILDGPKAKILLTLLVMSETDPRSSQYWQ
ncbi:MAG: asparaginase [Emcibacter sp.]|nr:asparaginase [Emcibacter sp.]